MNTKQFFTAAILLAGFTFTGFQAGAQRNRDHRDQRENNHYNNGRNHNDNRGQNRHYRHHPRVRVIVPPVAICTPPVFHRRYGRRPVRCATPVCYAPPRRAYHHRWHR